MKLQPMRLCLLAATVLLSSCKTGARIEVSGPTAAPIFHITEAGSQEPADIDNLTISTGDGEDRKSVWSIWTDSMSCERIGELRYGEPPRGFHEDKPKVRLEPGKIYYVAVSGCATGETEFKVVGDHVEWATRW